MEEIKNNDISYLLYGTKLKDYWEWLIEQAERVQESEISGANYWYNNYQEQIDVSIWQMKRMQELEEENIVLKATRAGNEEYINMLLQKNKRYREALEFYADEYVWFDENTGSDYLPDYRCGW